LGESGEKRKWRLRFAEWRAEDERILALVSVEGSSMLMAGEPLEGDIFLCDCDSN